MLYTHGYNNFIGTFIKLCIFQVFTLANADCTEQSNCNECGSGSSFIVILYGEGFKIIVIIYYRNINNLLNYNKFF